MIPVNADPEVYVLANLDWTCLINPDYLYMYTVCPCKEYDINIAFLQLLPLHLPFNQQDLSVPFAIVSVPDV